MVPIGVWLVDFKIHSDEIHSFGIRFLESIMSKTPLLAESFIWKLIIVFMPTWKLIVAFMAGIAVELFIEDMKLAFVDLNFWLGFRAKPPKEPPDKNTRSAARARLLPLIILCASFFVSWKKRLVFCFSNPSSKSWYQKLWHFAKCIRLNRLRYSRRCHGKICKPGCPEWIQYWSQ